GYASLRMVLADTGRHDTLAGGVPEWTTELIMPVGFAIMAVRFAWKSPGARLGRALCLLPIAVVALLGVLNFAKVIGPEAGSQFLAAHSKVVTLPGSFLLIAAFLLGTPVFVVMAGFALLFFFVSGTPMAAVPTETFRLVAN